ncbi:hypothetical protein CTAYLR_008119 [Chrysophaeum taylorii]|uniref:Ketoreductase domain-containing protein n=1 Tax=Chrysophaeum taylorii TaxID=2483200 RepID=A0AAD7UJY7_9STRA|nr:hypothetical protein CTAYLR_008119 [Chrysophaeum taylorii]
MTAERSASREEREGAEYDAETSWAVITGASSGIGSALAERAAASDLNVVLSGRRSAALESLAARLEREHGIATETVVVDLATPRGAERLHREATRRVARRGHQISVLAANAGVAATGPFLKQRVEDLDAMLTLNARSSVVLCQLFGRDFARARRGRICITGSIAGAGPHGVAGAACYGATKAFLRSFANALQTELRASGVTVICLMPGAVRSDFQRASGMGHSLVFRCGKYLPGGIVMTPEAVVRCVDFSTSHGRRREVVPGFANKFYAWGAKYLPSAVTRFLASVSFSQRWPPRFPPLEEISQHPSWIP